MRLCVITILLFIFLAFIASYSQAESFWPVFQQNPNHTGVAPASTAPDLELLWSSPSSAMDTTHIVLGVDGDIWVVGGSIDKYSTDGERTLHILGRDLGFQGEFTGKGSPAVLSDGTLIAMAGVRNQDKRFIATLYAVEPDGDVRWTTPFEGQQDPKSFITIGSEQMIYAGCPTCLYAVSQEGSIVWSYEHGEGITTIPAIATDGSVYFGAANSTLFCLTSDGSLDWTFRPDLATASPIDSAPTLSDDGHIYFVASQNGLYCLDRDSSVAWSYPTSQFCYTSPILFPDGSVGFHEMTENGPMITRLEPDGSMRWSVPLPDTTQAPLSSPAADQDGNIFFTSTEFDPVTTTKSFYMSRVAPDGTILRLMDELAQIGCAGGPCIGPDGTIYGQVCGKIVAFGRRQGRNVSVLTDAPGYGNWGNNFVNISISVSNAEIAIPVDCYVALRPVGGDSLLFWPFWNADPMLAAMQFRPLPGDAFFEQIEIAHKHVSSLPAGDYELFAGLFAPDTFDQIGDISRCTFAIRGAQTPDSARSMDQSLPQVDAFDADQVGTAPTIDIWTDKESYLAGEVLDLSLSMENQGLGMPCDLYIAATLEADPTGTLFFFPTWATDPMMTAVSFKPLAHGASLPDWTIMHLPLTDGLPKGDYKFLAAFFHAGTFELVSGVAETRWTLM